MASIPGFSGFSKDRTPEGKVLIHYREADGTGNTATFDSDEKAMAWLEEAAPKRLQQRARLRTPKVLLTDLMEAYPGRLHRNSVKPRNFKKYSGRVCRELTDLFTGCGWKAVAEMDTKKLDDYFAKVEASPYKRHRVVTHLKTFLKWINLELKHDVSSALLLYKVKKPKSRRTRKTWQDADFHQFEQYLLKDVDLLAKCVPNMPWHERIRECLSRCGFQKPDVFAANLFTGLALLAPHAGNMLPDKLVLGSTTENSCSRRPKDRQPADDPGRHRGVMGFGLPVRWESRIGATHPLDLE